MERLTNKSVSKYFTINKKKSQALKIFFLIILFKISLYLNNFL